MSDKQQEAKQQTLSKVTNVVYGLLSNKTCLVSAFLLSFSGILLKMFDVSTLILISLLLSSVILLLKETLKKYKRIGLINILPEKFKYLFLKKSILDILMDFWHLPSLGRHIKLLVTPLIYNYSPEESLKAIEALDSETVKMIKKEGIINVLPPKIQELLLPCQCQDNEIEEKKAENKKINNEDINLTKSTADTLIKPNREEIICNPVTIDNKEIGSNQSVNENNNSELYDFFNEKKIENTQIAKFNPKPEDKINSLLYFNKNKNEVEYSITGSLNKKYYQPNELLLVSLPEIKEEGDKVIYIQDDERSGKKITFRSVVLQSTKKLEEEKRKEKPYQWDNLHKYNTLVKKEDKFPKINFINLFKNYVAKSVFTKVKPETLYKSASAFSLFLILQILISKRMRSYSIGFIRLIVFILTSALSTYSLYVFINKLTEKKEKEIKEKKLSLTTDRGYISDISFDD